MKLSSTKIIHVLCHTIKIYEYNLIGKKAKVNYFEREGTNPIELYRKRHKEKIACLVS